MVADIVTLVTNSVTDEAVERAYVNAPEDWKANAAVAVENCAKRFNEFTTDEVWDALDEQPREPRALGGVMRRAARDGLIRKTNRVRNSTATKRHSRPMTIWESLCYGA